MELKHIITLLGFGVSFVAASISAIWLIILQIANIDQTTMRIFADNPAVCIVMIISIVFIGVFYNIIKHN